VGEKRHLTDYNGGPDSGGEKANLKYSKKRRIEGRKETRFRTSRAGRLGQRVGKLGEVPKQNALGRFTHMFVLKKSDLEDFR